MHIKSLVNSSILITGGTGSFGQAMTNYLCNNVKKIKRLVIYSRDELKQYKMAQKFPESKYPFIRFFLGDVRDEKRLQRALNGIDIIIHAAALKQVPAAEYNPFEFISTNVIGAQNIIEASLNSKVKKVVALSTDKASSPINLYGATKLCSDKLFVSANNYVGKKKLSFSYANSEPSFSKNTGLLSESPTSILSKSSSNPFSILSIISFDGFLIRPVIIFRTVEGLQSANIATCEAFISRTNIVASNCLPTF